MKAVLRALFAVAVIWLVYFLRGNVFFRLYPVVMCTIVWLSFVISSFRTPLVEIIARKRGFVIDGEGVRYCRRVNDCWVVFLTLHLAVTLASVFASFEFWAFYNGFAAYVLFGIMIGAEWLVRRRKKGLFK